MKRPHVNRPDVGEYMDYLEAENSRLLKILGYVHGFPDKDMPGYDTLRAMVADAIGEPRPKPFLKPLLRELSIIPCNGDEKAERVNDG